MPRIYEFNLDALTLQETVAYLSRCQRYQLADIPFILHVIRKYTTVNIATLPLRELQNLINQFNEALVIEVKNGIPSGSLR